MYRQVPGHFDMTNASQDQRRAKTGHLSSGENWWCAWSVEWKINTKEKAEKTVNSLFVWRIWTKEKDDSVCIRGDCHTMNCAYLKPNLEGTKTNRKSLSRCRNIHPWRYFGVCLVLCCVALCCVVLCCAVLCWVILPCFALSCLVLSCDLDTNLSLQRTYQMEGGSTNPNRAVEKQIQSRRC